jgi:hypothetical protein
VLGNLNAFIDLFKWSSEGLDMKLLAFVAATTLSFTTHLALAQSTSGTAGGSSKAGGPICNRRHHRRLQERHDYARHVRSPSQETLRTTGHAPCAGRSAERSRCDNGRPRCKLSDAGQFADHGKLNEVQSEWKRYVDIRWQGR